MVPIEPEFQIRSIPGIEQRLANLDHLGAQCSFLVFLGSLLKKPGYTSDFLFLENLPDRN